MNGHYLYGEGGQHSSAVRRPLCNDKDKVRILLLPNEKWTLGTPLQKVAQWSGQDLSGRPAM